MLKGDFCIAKFPLERTYLKNYFQSELSICFVKYYFEFEDVRKAVSVCEFLKLFTDHTGLDCHRSHKFYLFNKITELVEAETLAVENFDVDTLSKIKNGKYRFRCKY